MTRSLLALVFVAWSALARGGPTVAIADLDNHTGDPALDAAGAGVASVLISKLSRVEAMEVVERARLQELLAEVELGASGVVDASTAAEAGRVVGADYMVLGSIVSARLPAVGLAVRVVDVETGQVVLGEEVSGEVGERGEEFFVLIDELAFRVVDALEVRLAARERIELAQVDVRELKTVSVYGEALDAMDRGEGQEAEGLLVAALAMEPGFVLAESTLQRLAAEVSVRKSQWAHEDIEAVHRLWDTLEAQVAPLAAAPEPTLEHVVAMALMARLHLIHGRFEDYLELEGARVDLVLAHPEIHASSEYPDSAFSTAVRDRLQTLGGEDVDNYFRGLGYWPYTVRRAMASVQLSLGRRDEAVAAVIDTYQHRGPRRRATDGPRHPADVLGRWEQWEPVVVIRQQQLRMAELGGHDDEVKRALTELDKALSRAEASRADLRAYQGASRRVGVEAPSRELLRLEREMANTAREHRELALAGYRGFLRRVEAGWYDPVLESEPRDFRELASAWKSTADAAFTETWYVELKLAHLLAYHEQVPPRDGEEEARRQADVEQFIRSRYSP